VTAGSSATVAAQQPPSSLSTTTVNFPKPAAAPYFPETYPPPRTENLLTVPPLERRLVVRKRIFDYVDFMERYSPSGFSGEVP